MTDFQAVLGIGQLEDINNIIMQRIETANKYNDRLKEIDWIKTPYVYENRKMVYQTYHGLLDDDKDRDDLVDYLKSKDIEANLGSQSLPSLTYYKNKYKLKAADFPKAVRAYKQGLALPMGDQVDNDDIKLIIKNLALYLL